jgi:hypothetical protein
LTYRRDSVCRQDYATHAAWRQTRPSPALFA